VTEHSAVYSVDLERFENALSHIACGIFFHHTKSKWRGNTLVMTNELRDLSSQNSDEINNISDETIERVSIFLKDTESYGSNPNVFSYQVHDDRPKGYVVLMKFYSAITVAVTLLLK